MCLSSDNTCIPRTSDAGSVRDGLQVMHNGIAIRQGCYYGEGIELMLRINRGVHEPQEERVFGELLKVLPEGAVMMELGAYWAFYSIWFQSSVPNARSILIEASMENLEAGRSNFAINKMTGSFIGGDRGHGFAESAAECRHEGPIRQNGDAGPRRTGQERHRGADFQGTPCLSARAVPSLLPKGGNGVKKAA